MSDLTKWPRLLIVGDAVTREQANDILIRTNSWYLSCSDKMWTHTVAAAYGVPVGEYGDPEWKAVRAVYQELGCLDLHYLSNDRIMSSWIGGPKGWCDWDGTIGSANYNIGKWPTLEEVSEDLTAIAAAWPFLTMHVQLLAEEGEGRLLATWAVRDGEAHLVEPVGHITQRLELTEVQILGRLTGVFGERGVSAERLREALHQVRESREG